MQAFYTGASGLVSQSQSLDITANNLANAQTTGFKTSRANFQDLLYSSLSNGGIGSSGGPGLGVSFGGGAGISSTQLDFEQGPLQSTGENYDLAIRGNGFFAVSDLEGNRFFTRAGNFTLNADGMLTLPASNGGLLLEPPIQIPDGTADVVIGADGTVTADGVNVGQIIAVGFVNPEGLQQIGDNLFADTGASGSPQVGRFGQDGFGTLAQGFLEGSNVDTVEQIINLITTQQFFSLDAQSVQAANQELQTVLDLFA